MSDRRPRRCGEALIELLEGYGTEVVFGIPGVHTLELFRGLASSSIRTVLTRHEQGAGFMADGYARATGRPGVCCVITGPGLTNAATPIAQAYSDSVPVLAIASVNETASLGRGWGCLHESVDQLGLGRSITDSAACAYRADDLPAILAQAFGGFASGRPRPAIVQVPIDVLEETVLEEWAPAQAPTRAGPDTEAIGAACALLAKAERPALIAGGGAVNALQPLRELQRLLSLPVVSTAAGKGVVREDDRLALNATLNRPEVQRWLSERDLVLAVGTELSETDTWTDRLKLGGQLIRLDIDETRFSDRYPPAVAIHSDARLGCEALLSGLDGRAAGGDRGVAEPVPEVALTEEERQHQALLDEVRSALPADGRVYADMTQIAYTGVFAFPVNEPGRYLYPAGYGTLGYAVPAAIGGLIGEPSTPAVALVGDSGFQYTLQELATATTLGLPLVVCLWNNHALAEIRGDMVERDIDPIAVEPENPNFPMIAAGFGCEVRRPSTVSAVAPEVRAAVKRPGPTLIELDQRILFG